MLDTEAKLVAVALLSLVPDGKPSRAASKAEVPARSAGARRRV
jgi:hypothetical protein